MNANLNGRFKSMFVADTVISLATAMKGQRRLTSRAWNEFRGENLPFRAEVNSESKEVSVFFICFAFS
jgi:hypothetical protein